MPDQNAAAPAAPGIVAPNVRNLDELARDLSQSLAARIPDASDIRISDLKYPLGAGMSHETILFDADWKERGEAKQRGLVVRIKPSSKLVYLDDMFIEQYRLMEAMHRSGKVKVAAPLWLEQDTTLLGAPFFVMEKVHGRVNVSFPSYAVQGWLVEEATPAQRRIMWEDSVRQLAAIQTVRSDEVPFLLPPPDAPAGFDQEVDRYLRHIDWTDPGRELTLLRRCFDRLVANRPARQQEGIVWGDARLGNMMIGADYNVAAVMDWEQPSYGGALHDLGWWLINEASHMARRGGEWLEGMGSREETIALWEEVSGKSADDLAWYEVFASLKLECLAVKLAADGNPRAQSAAANAGKRTEAMMNSLPEIFRAA